MKDFVMRAMPPVIILIADLLVMNLAGLDSTGSIFLHVSTMLIYCFYLLTLWGFKDNKYFGFVMVSFSLINIVLVAGALVTYDQVAGEISKTFALRFLAVAVAYFMAETILSVLQMQSITKKAVKRQKEKESKTPESVST